MYTAQFLQETLTCNGGGVEDKTKINLAGRFDSVAGSRAEDRQIELKPLVIIFKQGFRVLSG